MEQNYLLGKYTSSNQNTTSKISMKENKISKLEIEIDLVNTECNQLKTETKNLALTNFIVNIDNDLTSVKSQISENIKNTEGVDKTIKDLKVKIGIDELIYSELKAKLDTFVNPDLQKSFEVFLNSVETIQLNIENLTEDYLNDKLQELKQKNIEGLQDLINDINSINVALNKVTDHYAEDYLNNELKQSLEIKKQQQLEVLSNLNVKDQEHGKFFERFNIVVNDSLSNWWIELGGQLGDVKRDLESTLVRNNLYKSNLGSFKLELDSLIVFIDQLNKRLKKEELINKLKILDTLKSKIVIDLDKIKNKLEEEIEFYFHTSLINNIYAKIDPHPEFKRVVFEADFKGVNPKLQIYIVDKEGNSRISPTLHFSSAQINVLSLSIFLAKAINARDDSKNLVNCIFIDDPIQSMDSINVLGVIDLLRGLTTNLKKQVIISTHNESFHALLKQKIPRHLFKSKFLKLETFGKVVVDDD